MIIRPLLADEIPRAEAIDGVEFPTGTLVIAALDDAGEIVGRIALMTLAHVEGTWVDEAHRGGTLAMRLVREAERALAAFGYTSALAFTAEADPKVGEYLARFGYDRLPMTVWRKGLATAATNGGAD